jgi:predicted nucleic acid-binding protein
LLARQGHHKAPRVADLLIAAAAEAKGWSIVHYDHDFDLIAKQTGQQARWVVARGTLPH